MPDEYLSRECAICGNRITGANYHCPNCKLCVCLGCGAKIVLAEHENSPSCPSCGSKLTARAPKEFLCSICKQEISETVNYYSCERFGKPLCIHHQKIVDQIPEKGVGYYCNDCKQEITFGEFQYSVRNFNTPLCRNCQRAH